MSVLNGLDTNYYRSEKRTLRAFLALFALFSILLLSALFFNYYESQKKIMLQELRIENERRVIALLLRLKELHQSLGESFAYPREETFESAIFDSDKGVIFSTDVNVNTDTINLEELIYLEGNRVYYIKEPEANYLGARYVVSIFDIGDSWQKELYRHMLYYAFAALAVVLFFGYQLARLMMRPVRNTFITMDRFIKDATHELNTPIASILANVEMLEAKKLPDVLQKKVGRIKIASKTLSLLFEDLVFATLQKQLEAPHETVVLENVLKERVEYFEALAQSKEVTITLEVKQEVKLQVQPKKLVKLIDNLLSNAIKYNKRGGKVVIIQDSMLCISDEGVGIAKAHQNELFERYKRFDTTQGGFGIGLNIVKMIADEYGYTIRVESEQNKGTRICLEW